MKTKATSVKVTRAINASPQEIFDSFQIESRLREWMCDGARTRPGKGGPFEVRWNSGYEARGVFTTCKPPSTLAFTWNSPSEPAETQVRVTLKPVEGGTQVTVIHSGFGAGKKWAGRTLESLEGWTQGLENLKSTLETGVDLRQANQPRLGLAWVTAPGNAGAVVTDVITGGPCEQAGLYKGDVIVRAGRRKIRGEQDLMSAYFTWRAGQRVLFAVVRAGVRKTIPVELGKRPVPSVPDDPAVLVDQVRQAHEQEIAALRASVLLLTDEQVGQPPAEGEWSVKQVLAHLSAAERGFHAWVANVLIGEQTPITGNLPEQFAAILASAPTAGALVDRFERDLAESRALIVSLTAEHRANKARCWCIAQMFLAFQGHTDDHLQQVQNTVRAIQKP